MLGPCPNNPPKINSNTTFLLTLAAKITLKIM